MAETIEMPLIAVALVVSGVTLGTVAVVAGVTKYCRDCNIGNLWGRLTGRLTDDEKKILVKSDFQAAYQVRCSEARDFLIILRHTIYVYSTII